MKKLLVLASILLVGCTQENEEQEPVKETPVVEEPVVEEPVVEEPIGEKNMNLDFTFTDSNEGWIYDVTDYPSNVTKEEWMLININGIYEDTFTDQQASWLIGNNHSDDIFVYNYLKVDGLIADSVYTGEITFKGVTPYSSDMVGIGGSPASSVYVKAGFLTYEPTPQIKEDMYFLPDSIHKGNQSQDGEDIKAIGTLADNQVPLENGLFELEYTLTMEFTTNAQGEAFVLVGYDSGFEGINVFGLTNAIIDINLSE